MRRQPVCMEVECEELGLDEVEEWIDTEADSRELNLVIEAAVKKLQQITIKREEQDDSTKRAVFVTVRIERTDKISDLLNYLLSHELEFEAEE